MRIAATLYLMFNITSTSSIDQSGSLGVACLRFCRPAGTLVVAGAEETLALVAHPAMVVVIVSGHPYDEV